MSYCSTIYSEIVDSYPLPNDKISDRSKFKAFADDKLDVVKMMISLFDQLGNTARTGENAGYQHFLLFSVFSKALGVMKSLDCLAKS